MQRIVLILGLAVALVATGCSRVGHDVAATVDDFHITVDDVLELVPTPVGAGSNVETTVLSGSDARDSLFLLVLTALVESELDSWGVTVGADVEEQARTLLSQQDPSFPTSSSTRQNRMIRFQAGLIALQQAIVGNDPTVSEAQRRQRFFELVGGQEMTCIELIQVQPAQVDQAMDLLATGATFGSLIQAGTPGDSSCLFDDEFALNYPRDGFEPFYDAEVGVLSSYEPPPELAAGAFVYRIAAVEPAVDGPDSDAISLSLAEIERRGIGPWIVPLVDTADIEIDSRFGADFTLRGVEAPEVPLVPVSDDPLVNLGL